MQRGEVWWASLPPPSGSGPGFRRPVLVVQADEFNASNIQTVMVAAITSNRALAAAPGNVLLERKHSRLRKGSVVNVSQIVTIDKRVLTKRVASLPRRVMAAVDAGLKLALHL
ncbi:MAG TPA: type II toxin-antitoxin system PemK/MazF family toxin [Thermoanaerobaculales bacterium]|mgnify:CR=1 FL=1|nr:type II toxin-antitoxin system PemK/MazF family toxin [Thermoanaerobaculales bacterium]HPA82157.1 type II toxin-antitoxin system PemK/MazF family toxin [Thermoanaerobaculales bacterium]HQL28869.1 type II toxin-antitoxin system PemK/MazF family toxin [Thermoanaerobaculales bacterium]HQN96360.1 type II toxin-antitoxin system PemK/MazF family toxin [Thermoanaerobaculales bacterium]HQP43705.1 type II toxin-antitoxin system PemK/MazF family toxin [Thermoanaerobaculales bacterium]